MIDGLKPETCNWRRVGDKPKAAYARLSLKIGYQKTAWLADVSPTSIANWRKRFVGERRRHERCVIPDGVVMACRRAHHLEGQTIQHLARRYVTKPSTLHKAVAGYTYGHLPMPWDEEAHDHRMAG
jgi:hypothetical protein